MSSLAEKMHQWKELKTKLDQIELDITIEVQQLKSSQSVETPTGVIQATYSKGRRTTDYKAAGAELESDLDTDTLTSYTVTNINYTKMVKDLADEALVKKHTKVGAPSVKVSFKPAVDDEPF